MSPDLLPPVAPSVTADLVEALSPRLRKRLDAGVAKLAARPLVRDGDTVRIAVDDDTDLELHAPDGVVTTAEAIRCGCLLAPDCLHRAAAASAAPVAQDTPTPATPAPAGQEPGPGREGGPGRGRSPRSGPSAGTTTCLRAVEDVRQGPPGRRQAGRHRQGEGARRRHP
ncbi:SWIM zinc finger family protein, partial [Streptomyces sp. ID05-04B]